MIQAILADDEGIIVKGLKKLIDWERLGVEIVGEAGDGAEALELIKKRHPSWWYRISPCPAYRA